MKAISAKPTRGIQVGSNLICVDNTGAKLIRVISFKNYGGRRKRRPCGGVGSVVTCAVKVGVQKMMHEKVVAVIVRQAMPYRRPNGMWIHFEDNAAVLIDDKNEPKGKEIKGVVAKEAVERFSVIGKIASMVL